MGRDLTHDVDRHEATLRAHDERIRKLETDFSALAAKIAVYAAMGSMVGGALIAVAFSIFKH